jgi:hypothetical protein
MDEAAQLLGDPQHGIGQPTLGRVQVVTGQEGADDLADEQRIAGGDVVHPGDHRPGRRPASHPQHVAAHLRAAEPP